MVYILGQNGNEIVAMAAVLRQGLLQGGHHIRWRLQADDIVGNGERQFDSLDQDLSRTFRKRARQGNGGENSAINLLNYFKKRNTKYLEKETKTLVGVCSPAGLCSQDHIYGVHSHSHDINHCLSSLGVCQAVNAQ